MASLKGALAQGVAWLMALALAGAAGVSLGALELAMLQAPLAAIVSVALRAEKWWIPIHLLFSPALVAALRADVSPVWPALAFAALALTYWSVSSTRVPLFLSSRAAGEAVARLLPRGDNTLRCVDLGSGTGSLLVTLSKHRPDCELVGIEAAPLPFLLSRWRTAGSPRVQIRRGDFWRESLGGYDLVYAFLSPEPMLRLWRKACEEMDPGALLVSNSFPVPDVEPDAVHELSDRRATRLFCYRIRCNAAK